MVVPTPLRGSLATGGDGAGPSGLSATPERNPLVLAAAAVAGVSRAFTIGGAQAVAALAYGTQTVPQVDKITGPGNAYVASAKRRVFGTVGIDMIAGPSEILVIADGSTPPDWVAMDLFSQAEHDELAQSILLCPDAAYLDAVSAAMNRLLAEMPRREVIRASLEGRGALILTRSMQEACEISNRIAPEHLEVSSDDPHRWEPLLRHAGAIFLGGWTSESLGDYCAGPNHVLPTSGTARFSSPLGVYDFQKRSSLIEVSAAGARTLGPVAAELAYGEGLQAHARAAEMRLNAPSAEHPDATGRQGQRLAVRPVTEAMVDAMIPSRWRRCRRPSWPRRRPRLPRLPIGRSAGRWPSWRTTSQWACCCSGTAAMTAKTRRTSFTSGACWSTTATSATDMEPQRCDGRLPRRAGSAWRGCRSRTSPDLAMPAPSTRSSASATPAMRRTASSRWSTGFHEVCVALSPRCPRCPPDRPPP